MAELKHLAEEDIEADRTLAAGPTPRFVRNRIAAAVVIAICGVAVGYGVYRFIPTLEARRDARPTYYAPHPPAEVAPPGRIHTRIAPPETWRESRADDVASPYVSEPPPVAEADAAPAPRPRERPASAVRAAPTSHASAHRQSARAAYAASVADAYGENRKRRVPARCVNIGGSVDRMVCSHRDLAAQQRKLDVLYLRALRTSSHPDKIRAQHRRWLDARARAAHLDGPKGVAQLYRLRIAELGGD